MTEEIVKFGPGEQMVGVLSSGTESEHSPVVLMFNAGFLHRVGPFRLWVDCARTFSSQNIPSLRFDLCGLGDSKPGEFDHDTLKNAVDCQIKAMDLVESKLGKRDFIVLGLCSGADYSYPAMKADSRIRGAVLIDGFGYKTRRYPISRHLQRMLSPRRWKLLFQKALLQPLRPLAETGFEVREFPPADIFQSDVNTFLDEGRRFHFIYTAGVPEYYNYKNQFWEMFPKFRPHQGLQYTYYGKSDHTFSLVSERRDLLGKLLKFSLEHQSQKSLAHSEAHQINLMPSDGFGNLSGSWATLK